MNLSFDEPRTDEPVTAVGLLHDRCVSRVMTVSAVKAVSWLPFINRDLPLCGSHAMCSVSAIKSG
ncbi:hypothetical protein SAMN06265222_102251 [Neorhodopirellula lusitana]|uniref:Uncharacterized protein n=1 Tax=Neorhodopirellula lusitana TaxID=445327 RepID=A0ABY1PVH3_9BACT|nr:hypothetical protein SAMN06265222_102251 [Neorhodopirellula lusitana]